MHPKGHHGPQARLQITLLRAILEGGAHRMLQTLKKGAREGRRRAKVRRGGRGAKDQERGELEGAAQGARRFFRSEVLLE